MASATRLRYAGTRPPPRHGAAQLNVSPHSTRMKLWLAIMVLTASSSAFSAPPDRQINAYPFAASPERAAAIRANHVRITHGMSPAEVKAILGEADEVLQLYAPRAKSGSVIGYTQWYVIGRLVAHGSAEDKRESLVRVTFDLNDRVTRVDAWGL